MSGIRLSDKHGVNPSVYKCFWCGGDIGVALFGRLKDDVEAPRTCYVDYDPCDKCKETWERGVIFIEVSKHPQHDGQLSLQPSVPYEGGDAYPTGRHFGLTFEGFKHIFDDSEASKNALECGKCLVLQEDFEPMIERLGIMQIEGEA